MKLLMLVSGYPSLKQPNKGIFFKRLAEGLVAFGIEVTIVCPQPYSNAFFRFLFSRRLEIEKITKYELLNGVKIFRPVYLRFPFFHKLGLSHYFMWFKMKDIVSNIQFDVLDVRCPYPTYPLSDIAQKIKSTFKKPYLYTLNGSHFDLNTETGLRFESFSKLLMNADKVNSVSETGCFFIRKKFGLKCGITIHPVALDQSILTLSKEEVRIELGLKSGIKVLLFVGEISREKGVDILLNSFLQLDMPDCELVLLGSGYLSDYLIHPRVKFVGRVKNELVQKYMRASDLFVFPSRMEGMPNVVKEAGALGLPVIASAVGGIPQLLANGQRGILLGELDSTVLTSAICYAFENPVETFEKALLLKEHVEECYSLKPAIESLVDDYKDVLNL